MAHKRSYRSDLIDKYKNKSMKELTSIRNRLDKRISRIPDHKFIDGSYEDDPELFDLVSNHDYCSRIIRHKAEGK